MNWCGGWKHGVPFVPIGLAAQGTHRAGQPLVQHTTEIDRHISLLRAGSHNLGSVSVHFSIDKGIKM